jgi:hypothetical protein
MTPNTARVTYRPLRIALLANAAFSLLSGLLFIAFASAIATRVGHAVPPTLIGAIGIMLVPFGGLAAWVGTRSHPPTWAALLISVSDLIWVIASAVVVAVAHGNLTSEGTALASGIALAVLAFALGQLRGIARVYRIDGATNGRVRVCIEFQTAGDAATVWRNVADLGGIARFAPMLAKSALRDDAPPGVGALRECIDRGGRQWSERCVHFDPAKRELEVEFLANLPGFPFPFSALRGGWQVQSVADEVAVKIWWDGTLKYPTLASVIPPLLAWQAQRQFAGVVRQMAGHGQVRSASAVPRLAIVPC